MVHLTFPLLNCFTMYTWLGNVKSGKFIVSYCDLKYIVTNSCYSLAHIESLSTTGAYEDVILGSFPKEAPPYKSLWTPFDYQTWILLLLSIMVVSLSLYVVERIWYKMKNGGNFKNDGMYPNHVEKA